MALRSAFSILGCMRPTQAVVSVMDVGQEVALQQADTAIQSAMQSIGSRGGTVVLQQYRCSH